MQPDNGRNLEVTTHHSAGTENRREPVAAPSSYADTSKDELRARDPLSSKPNIINLLYLLSFATAFSGIVGLVLCYVWRNDPGTEDWEQSHLQYQIRTFWFGLLGFVIGLLLMIVLIGFFIWIAVAVWTVVRCVMSFTQAQKGLPMPNPTTLLW